MSDPVPPPDPPKRHLLGQVSPWRDPKQSILLSFTAEGSQDPLVRVMVTNENPNLVGSRYALGTEYWHAVRTLPEGQRLFMSYTHGAWSVAEHDRLVADLPAAYSAPQNARGLWTAGRTALSSDLVRYQYTAQDPDAPNDPRARIGLMLGFGEADGLCQSTWFKASEPSTGYVWHDASSPVNGLLWSPTTSLETLSWSFAQGRKRPA